MFIKYIDLLKGKRKRSEQPEEDQHEKDEDNESYNTIQFKRAGFSKYQKTDQDFQAEKSFLLPAKIDIPIPKVETPHQSLHLIPSDEVMS